MTRRILAVMAVLVLIFGAAVPGQARGGGGGGHGGVSHGGGHWSGGHGHWSGHHGHWGHRGSGWWWGGAFYGGWAYPWWYPYYGGDGTYGSQDTTGVPTTTYQVQPIQREVVDPNGKYVLRGDGVTQAWQWIWVPAETAPTAPPPR